MIFLYIVYHDEGGTHASIIAAAIHLNLLPTEYVPNKSEFKKLLAFNSLDKKYYRRLVYQGKDEYNNQIYTLGRKHAGHLATNVLQSVTKMVEGKGHEVFCVDTSPFNNYRVSLWSRCSMKLRLYSLGYSLATLGAIKVYPQLVKIVQKTKLKIAP